jgi:hypothetical protein
MRDEHRDRMLLEMARAFEMVLAELAGQPFTSNSTEMLDAATALFDARRTFEQHYD